jgi:hypothetical protein
MTVTVRLTGQQLLDFVEEFNNPLHNRTEMIQDAGYVYDSGKTAYADFYTELLKAKEELDPTYLTQQEVEDAEYEDLKSEEQQLYDEVHNLFGEKWDHEEIMEFMDKLDDIGINSATYLRECFTYVSDDAWNAEEEFAKYYLMELHCAEIPSIIEEYIKWQAFYNTDLKYEYNNIDFDGSTYFFRNI